MDDGNALGQIAINIEPGEEISHIVCIVVVETMNSFRQEIRVSTTPQTGRITEIGALTEALEMAKMPDYEYVDEEDEEE